VKPVHLPLFWKFSIAIASTVLLFGSLNLLFIRNQVYKTFENQLEKHGISLARGIAERAIEPILYDDLSALNNLLMQTLSVNTDIKYIFILDNYNQLLAHTFKDYIPLGIIEVNTLGAEEDRKILVLDDPSDKNEVIRDIAIPILGNQAGTVRIGLSEQEYLKEIKSITRLFLGMVFFFLALGIIAAFVLSYIITNPVKAISKFASQVDLHTFNPEKSSIDSLEKEFSVKLKNLFNLTDEIDVLSITFNQMIMRLQAAYRELKDTQESLSQTEKMASVGTLAAGLAHEINNPLAGIRNCMRRIEDNPENIRQNSEYIAMMLEALQKIEKVVQGMLNFSRKQELIFTQVKLNDLLKNSTSLVRYQLNQSKIKLDCFIDDDNVSLDASPNHLEQVFVNILLNSIDAINERKQTEPKLEGKITIRLFESKEDNEVKIIFTDNGIGLPHDKVASIFDPFFTLKKIKQGTGLGLAVSYNIINSHKGQINGCNIIAGGFAISITLPLNR
jgi:two-component system, NtrC family, sensor kinase